VEKRIERTRSTGSIAVRGAGAKGATCLNLVDPESRQHFLYGCYKCVLMSDIPPVKQRVDEWLSVADDYHTRQFREPMRSTVAFCDWLEAIDVLHKHSRLKILDMCSGQGANIAYMKRRFPCCAFLGIDIISDVVQKGNRYLDKLKLSNCRLERGDLFNLEKRYIGQFDGITCYQTLSWLPGFLTPLVKMLKLDPTWVGLTSLFFDGDVSCRIEVH
jgi:SAM-dependent methyltransferase